MRELRLLEMEQVSGGDWTVELNGGVVKVIVSGEESIQDMAAAGASLASDAYWGARDAVADFYEWAANGWNYSMACGYQ